MERMKKWTKRGRVGVGDANSLVVEEQERSSPLRAASQSPGLMDRVVRNSIQFPDEDDDVDCPVATPSEQVCVAQGKSDVTASTAAASPPRPPAVVDHFFRLPSNGLGNFVDRGGRAVIDGDVENGAGAVIDGDDRPPVVRNSGSEGNESSSSGEDDDDDEELLPNAGNAEAAAARNIDDGEEPNCECFVCDFKTTGYQAADLMRDHIESAHGLQFERLKSTFKLDYPSFVQFVRWAREMKALGNVDVVLRSLRTLNESNPSDLPWSSDRYLLPPAVEPGDARPPIDYFLTLDDNPHLETGELGVEELLSQIERLKVDKDRMAAVFQRIVASNVEEKMPRSKHWYSKSLNTSPNKRPGNKSPSKCIPNMENDDPRSHNQMYFDSYDELSIHHDMIFDHSRTEAYRQAIVDRADDIKGKVVMDLGCGSGILSMFCAQQGAKVVHAIDKSNIIFDAMSNSFENNMDKIIKFHHKDLDNDDTSDLEQGGKVDILVSEFMGYFLFFEGMTESFIRARKKYLKPDGVLMPDCCTIELAPFGPSGIYKKRVDCWNEVYGFKMPAMKHRALKEPLMEIVHPEEIIGNRVPVKYLDLRTCDVSDVYIMAEFEFEFEKDTDFCGVAGFFSVDFTGPNRTVTLPTSPWDTPTHWKQTVFFFPTPIKVSKGEKMAGTIRSCNHKDDPRWLFVLLTFGKDKKFFYEIK